AQARVLGATLRAGEYVEYPLAADRMSYLVAARGQMQVNDLHVEARDGVAIKDVAVIGIKALQEVELVLVDVSPSTRPILTFQCRQSLSQINPEVITPMKLSNVSSAVVATLTVSTAFAASTSAAPTLTSVKGGTYKVESYHTQVSFSLSHFGFTNYSGL